MREEYLGEAISPDGLYALPSPSRQLRASEEGHCSEEEYLGFSRNGSVPGEEAAAEEEEEEDSPFGGPKPMLPYSSLFILSPTNPIRVVVHSIVQTKSLPPPSLSRWWRGGLVGP